MIIDTDSPTTNSYPFKTMIQITLAVMMPTQMMEKKAMITLQVTKIKIRKAKISEINTVT